MNDVNDHCEQQVLPASQVSLPVVRVRVCETLLPMPLP